MSDSILKISEAASLAIHSMVILAQAKGNLVSVKKIATTLEVSANHLSKVLQRLNKAGYIDSIKGNSGGFKLVKDPAKVTFMEIYEIFDGKLKSGSCLLAHKKCKDDCMFGSLIKNVNKQVHEKFKNTKLSDFIK